MKQSLSILDILLCCTNCLINISKGCIKFLNNLFLYWERRVSNFKVTPLCFINN